MHRLFPLILVLGACSKGPNLPEGWEDAELLKDFQQSDCAGDPGSATESFNAFKAPPTLEVEWTATTFRCDQQVEGYLRRLGVTQELLVQPVDMEPDTVARCDCLYDLDIQWNIDETLETLVIYKRADEYGGPSSKVMFGQLNFEAQ